MVKRIVAVVLILVLCMGFVSCGKTKSVNGDQPTTLTPANESEFVDISSTVGKTASDKSKLVLTKIYGQNRIYYVFNYDAEGKISETCRYYQFTNQELYERKLKIQFEGTTISQTCDIFIKNPNTFTIGMRENDPTLGYDKGGYDETLKYYTSNTNSETDFTVV